MQEYRPIAEWLKSTRERQRDEKGDTWTQDRLLDLMHAEVGWAPHRPNYSKYESGKATPKRETLAKFVAFWAARGEPGPDLSPRELVVAPDPQMQLVSAITALVEEMRLSRAQQDEATQALLQAVAAVVPGVQGRRGTSGDREHEARAGTGR